MSSHNISPSLLRLIRDKSLSASRLVRMQVLFSIAEPIPACGEASAFSGTWVLTWSACGCWCRLLRLWPPIHPSIHSQHPILCVCEKERDREDLALWDTIRSLEWVMWREIKQCLRFHLEFVELVWRWKNRNTLRISVPDGLTKSATRSEWTVRGIFFFFLTERANNLKTTIIPIKDKNKRGKN